jgi:hypothetical protein
LMPLLILLIDIAIAILILITYAIIDAIIAIISLPLILFHFADFDITPLH